MSDLLMEGSHLPESCVKQCHQNVLVLSLKMGEKISLTPNHMTSGKSKKGEKKEWSGREGRAVEDERRAGDEAQTGSPQPEWRSPSLSL